MPDADYDPTEIPDDAVEANRCSSMGLGVVACQMKRVPETVDYCSLAADDLDADYREFAEGMN